MAILKGDLEFTGSIGGLSAYKVKGIDKTILRNKGGANKKQILKSPAFVRTRENYTEFAACAKLGGSIRRSMLAMAPMADYNFTPLLSSLAKTIQCLDTESKRGERNILLSQHRNLLVGFSLNRNISFESIVRHPIHCSLDRAAGKAVVQLPSLMPGVNLMTSKQYPLFRFVINLGYVADRVFGTKGYVEEGDNENCCVYTDWHHTAELFEERELIAQLKDISDMKESSTFILSVGIQMGIPVTNTVVNPVKYAGCAKIMAVA